MKGEWFKYKIQCEGDDLNPCVSEGLLVAENYADAMGKIVDDYGEAYLQNVTIEHLEEWNCLELEEILAYFEEGDGAGPLVKKAITEASEVTE